MDFNIYDVEFNRYITALEEVLSTYIPVSDYMDIFEADNPEVQKQNQDNTQKQVSGENFLLNAVKSIKALIAQMIESIKNFFKTLTMSKDEKAKYDAFVQKCKSDPSLKNKKITLTDYRRVNAEYDALIKEAETAISTMKENQPNSVDNLLEKMKNGIKGVTKGATVIVTAEVVDKIAASNREFAEVVYKKLREDENIMNELEKQIGHAKARDFKSRMRLFSSKCKLKQEIVKLRYKQYNNAKEAVEQTYREIKGLMTGDPNFAKNNDPNEANRKWYKKGNTNVGIGSSALSRNNSNGIVGKISGNEGVRSLAGGVSSLIASNAAKDAKFTLATKLGISKNARYQKLRMNEPKRTDCKSEAEYASKHREWNKKCEEFVRSEKDNIIKEINKNKKKEEKKNQGRNKNMESFLGDGIGSSGTTTDIIGLVRSLF